MAIHLISGSHLTAHDRAAITQMIGRGMAEGKTPRKRISISTPGDGTGRRSVTITTSERNDYGKSIERRAVSVIEVTATPAEVAQLFGRPE